MVHPKIAGESPWRSIFEEVRGALHNQRDESGVIGSINWLRKKMELRGGNPNVVRNIIYRDKGKLTDKRILYTILSELWESTGQTPLRAPELDLFLNTNQEGELEVAQLLGREKRRIYQQFVGAVRNQQHPKVLITGRAGSGKTLLTDYIQQALEQSGNNAPVLRQEFTSNNLAGDLALLANSLGISEEIFAAKLAKVGVASAFSVQADAQADVVRVLLEHLRQKQGEITFLLHISQTIVPGTDNDQLAGSPLRLNTPEVPRVSLTEWLWHTLIEPLGRLPRISLLISMADLPLSMSAATVNFEGPLKLSPPTISEARRFVKTRTQHLSSDQQEALVQRAKRSFEDLRTLTLLADAREPLEEASERHTEQLSKLVISTSNPTLKDFLEVLAVLTLPEYQTVSQEHIEALRSTQPATLGSLELSFLDASPNEPGHWKPFSRSLMRAVRDRFKEHDLNRFRALSLAASQLYAEEAHAEPHSEAARRYVHHLFAARAWPELVSWADFAPIPQALLQKFWKAARLELQSKPGIYEAAAMRVASYYVHLGNIEHPNAQQALDILSASEDAKVRAWTLLKRAESTMLQGRFDDAEGLLTSWQDVGDPGLNIEAALIQANLARWHSKLNLAAQYTDESLRLLEAHQSEIKDQTLAVRTKLWRAIVLKDRGELGQAITLLDQTQTADELMRARLDFQRGYTLMNLGRFDEAQVAFNSAVSCSLHAEAPIFEQSRYLTKRATLARLQGNYQQAADDFAYAKAILNRTELGEHSLRLSFVRAKIENEEALCHLAKGNYDQAISTLDNNLETFQGYSERYNTDPSFRMLRATLYLAYAYAHRALHVPLRLPLNYSSPRVALQADLEQARGLLKRIMNTLESMPERFQVLKMQVYLLGSLLSEDQEAVQQAKKACDLANFAYQEAVAKAHLTAALLHTEQIAEARQAWHQTVQLANQSGHSDTGMQAYVKLLEVRLLLFENNADSACRLLSDSLQQSTLHPFHALMLRDLGEYAELRGITLDPDTLGLGDSPLSAALRPSDALISRWEQRLAYDTETGVLEPTR